MTNDKSWPLLTRAQVAEAVEYATSRTYRRMYRRAMRAERALRRASREVERLHAACRAARLVLAGTTAIDVVQQATILGTVEMLDDVLEGQASGEEGSGR